MKIAVNTRFLLKGKLEGIGWYTHEIVKRLVLANPEHEFLFLFDRKHDPTYIYAKNVQPIVIAPPARHPFLWYLWFEKAVPRVLKKQQVDVFFSPDGYGSTATEVPTVLTVHDLAYLHFKDQVPALVLKYYQHYVPKHIQKAEKIIAVSDYTKNDILKHFNIDSNKIKTAHNACREGFKAISVNEKNKTKTRYTQGEDFFFYAGAVHPRKNVNRLIEAFDIYKNRTQSTIKLVIAGRLAWQTGPVKEAYEKSSFKKDIIFPGYVEDLGQLMAAALAMVYVSRFEGFGLPILEAMHCDVPVITSEHSSMSEVAGDAAVLVNPNDVKEIATALETVSTNETLRENLIAKAKLQRAKFSWDDAAAIIWDEIKLLF